MHDRVCESRSVHVDQEIVFPSEFSHRGKLRRRVDRAEFRSLSQTNYPGFVRMDSVLFGEDRFRTLQRNLAGITIDRMQLRAAAEKLRRSAFIRLNVSEPVTNNAVEWLAELGQRECVRGGAIENQVNVTIAFEDLTNAITNLRRENVFAVGRLGAGIPLLKRGHRLGKNARRIIARELVAPPGLHHSPC